MKAPAPSDASGRHLRRLSLTAAVLGLAVTAAGAVLSAFDVKGRPAAAVGIGIAMIGAAGLLIDYRRQERELAGAARTGRSERASRVSELLEVGLPLPYVRDVNPFRVGVFDSRIARGAVRPGEEEPPYVSRVADEALDEALVRARVILVSGPVKAGKSRTAFEALRRNVPDHCLVVPRYDAPLRDLIDLAPWQDPPVGEVVLWLDDLDRWFGQGGLDRKLLNQLVAPADSPRVQVVATIRSERLTEILEHSPPPDAPFEQRTAETTLAGEARQVLQWIASDPQAAMVRLGVELTGQERMEAGRAYPGLKLLWLGRELAGTDELVRRVEERVGEVAEVGWALVRATVDWERVGMRSVIGEGDLVALADGYDTLVAQRPRLVADAREWALKRVDSGAALLARVRDEPAAYAAFDFIVDVLNGAVEPHVQLAMPVAEHAWRFALARAAEGDLTEVGQAIVFQSARPGGMASANAGEAALEPLVEAGAGRSFRGWAAYALGQVREQRENWAGAEAAYKRGLDLVRPQLHRVRANDDLRSPSFNDPLAYGLLSGLARVCLHQGDALVAEAQLACADRAQPRLNPEIPVALLDRVRPRGVFPYDQLASQVLETDEDVQRRAAGLFSRALNSRVAGLRATAHLYAGALRQRTGDLAGAEGHYRQAEQSGVTDAAERGRLSLAVLDLRSGDLAKAEPILRSLSGATVPSVAATVHVALGLLLMARGDQVAANTAEEARHYRHRLEEAPPGFGPSELVLVRGLLRELRGDRAGARHEYESLVGLGEEAVGEEVVAEARARLADPSLQA